MTTTARADLRGRRYRGGRWLWRLLCLVALPVWAKAPEPPGLPVGIRADVAVPDVLRPWTAWALAGHEQQALCPFLDGQEEARECLWPAELRLVLDDHGGRLSERWQVYRRAWATLPGSAKRWPLDVRVDGQPALVAPHGDDDAPAVLLGPGVHVVTASFVWDALPESLPVPKETGLLALTVRGQVIAQPLRGAEGELWLQKGETREEADVLELTVHRKVSDGIPLELATRLELRVSGRNREVLLGRALPPEFVPMSLVSALPARYEPDGRLRVQVRPGTWVLTLVGRHDGPVTSLTRPMNPPSPSESPWASGDEVWVFEAQPDLRQVTIEGVAAIDPQQTTLPDEWKRLPAYPMKPGAQLKLVEQRRGDSDPAPDRLSLTRQLWLDFDGTGYTVTDHIAGTLRRAWRLEVEPPTELGRVAVGGKDQFITRSPGAGQADAGTRAGVEVRQGKMEVTADSRVVGAIRRIPAVGWATDFHHVEATLHLPPGWRLFYASGADAVSGTWIAQWSLLDLFLVLLVTSATVRLYGLWWGALALVTLGLLVPESDAPTWMWLVVLGLEALLRVLSAGRLERVIHWFHLAVRAALAVWLVVFAVAQVRQGLYPALDTTVGDDGNASFPGLIGMAAAPLEEKAVDAPPEQAAAAEGGEAQDAEAMKQQVVPKSIPVQAPAKADRLRGKLSTPASTELTFKHLVAPGRVQQRKSYLQEYDPHAVIQTGPGLPRWQWHAFSLRWNGPVERRQELELYLVPPWANLGLALLRVLLAALLLLRVLGVAARHLPGPLVSLLGRGSVAVGLLILLAAPSVARADLPSPELLDKLAERLLEAPECHPRCATSSRMRLDVTRERLTLRIEISAAAATAVPLPGSATQWSPEQVLVDGRPATALRRDDAGRLWVGLVPGNHQVLLDGALGRRDTVQIALPLKPHRVEAQLEGWRLEGLHEDGLADDDLQLSRVRRQDETGGGLVPGVLPSFVRIERELHLGLVWEADTRVVRLTPPGTAVVLEVPLLAGESVTTPEVRVVGGKALVNMGPSATEVTWHSLLQERTQITLMAPRGVPWVEQWQLDVSPVWHVELGGIPMVHGTDEQGVRAPVWQPWPGESVQVRVSRPAGVAGQTLTIDHSKLVVKPGLRASDVTLVLELRTSRGVEHVLTLPERAVLQSVSLDGRAQPVRQEGRRVRLLLSPGRQRVELVWRESAGIALFFRAPAVDLGAPNVNADIEIETGGDRWTLFCGGPRLGPAVRFWSLVLVLVLVSLLLGRVTWTPLAARHWLLLGLGLSQVPIVAAAVVVAWLLLLGWRKEHPAVASALRFNLRQLALVALSAMALGILVTAIQEGLLGEPDMQIAGNLSRGDDLRWFQDRSAAVLPRPWVLSLPMVAYRVAMLLWALWMARALLGWLRFGWTAMSAGGWWKKRLRLRPLEVGPAVANGAPPPEGAGSATTGAVAASAGTEDAVAEMPVTAAERTGEDEKGKD